MFRLVIMLLFLVLCPSTAQALDISLVGDSHMEGVAPELQRYLSERGHTVHVVAHRGWSCRSYVRAGQYLRRQVSGSDLVVILLGANDRPRTSSAYEDDLNWVLSQTGNAQVVWFGPPTVEDSTVDLRHLQVTRMQSQLLTHTPWFDSRPDTELLTHNSGGIHFTRRSYRTWASRIVEHLSSYL